MKTAITLGLVLLALLTAARLPAWSNNLAVWSAAVREAPELPRPALNLGMAFLKAGEPDLAAIWLVRAAELAERRQGPRDHEVLILVRRGFDWLEAFGTPICSEPSAQRFC